MLKKRYLLLVILGVISCKKKVKTTITAQEIIDKSILVSGGELYKTNVITFKFRDVVYVSKWDNGRRVLKRIMVTDTSKVVDINRSNGLTRYLNEKEIVLSDSIANLYANSVNSVHYFAHLPYGLNDPAVKKESLGEKIIKGKAYYKLKVTFNQKGGGDDYDDVYVYWINKATFKPDYLAYKFHVNGGGMRFRVAYNERYVGGIRFVDYENYGVPLNEGAIYELDTLFEAGKLKILSKIMLCNISVKPLP